MNKIVGIIWDFGGVITESPFEAFNRFETKNNFPLNFIRSVNAKNPTTNAWAQLESSRIDLDEFDRLFFQETKTAGYAISGKDVIPLLNGAVRMKMVRLLAYLKGTYKQLCLTNNMKVGRGVSMYDSVHSANGVEFAMGLFDDVVESSEEGLRKPDQGIYELACERLGILPSNVAYLDDLGINLKPARKMGMTTIKVLSEDQVITDLGFVLGEDLLRIQEKEEF